MDPKILDLVSYLCLNSFEKTLTEEKLTKLLFLLDWEYCQKYCKKIANLTWRLEKYGPQLEEPSLLPPSDSGIEVINGETLYGESKRIFHFSENRTPRKNLTAEELEVVNSVLEKTKNLHWDGIQKLVFSSLPIRSANYYGKLDILSYLPLDTSKGN